jgi:putative endonuclease
MAQYYVYIMTNPARTLYTGVTNDLERRVFEHRERLVEGFTKRYGLTTLVYYEASSDVRSAIEREKQIKGWLRRKKVALIESVNPEWMDLAAGRRDGDTDSSLRSE